MTAHNQDLDPERLLRISDEVSRIASTLARISTGSASLNSAPPYEQTGPAPDVPVGTVRSAIRARRLRERFFEPELFADPAWDMMLDLFEAELSHRRVAVSSLCIAAAVPATTALRWLKSLTEKGLVIRRADPLDGRRIYVELSSEASAGLSRYFAEVGNLEPA